ncbi:BON domain-containing protein [Ohtaekwangia koreensis]|uniref:Osmotically-inducible protein OsmY, contains BON domain n=1 Tax=Ohtaekwangia koreensis TaxID=688867 RepID=A0A1T5M5F0_9BACT|nr:BON domain-containing protein [Ohtaekwangia koreensis]SKC83461.1 Osmotically-inducible protein OsmY, contains BON domain [Ohtaekwangia koreensis]
MKTNEELRKDVMEEIKWDPKLRNVATEIGVASKDGVITLSGILDSYWKKIAAEKAAQRVLGVKVVACDIEVKIGNMGKRTDTEIAEAVRNALRWNSAVNEDRIEVKVDEGWVYLDGAVDFEFEKRYAIECVEDLLSVRGVTNNVSVKVKPIDTKDIQHKISAAYHRSATVDSSSIHIEAAGNKVTLRGKVKSWAEKKEAENIAWAAPGVMVVDNKIEIDVEVYA